MFCKLFINFSDHEKIINIIEKDFGRCIEKNRSCLYFDRFEIDLLRNKEILPENLSDDSDRFLYYPTIAELEIYSDYAAVTDKILLLMRQNNIHTVAAYRLCPYHAAYVI